MRILNHQGLEFRIGSSIIILMYGDFQKTNVPTTFYRISVFCCQTFLFLIRNALKNLKSLLSNSFTLYQQTDYRRLFLIGPRIPIY